MSETSKLSGVKTGQIKVDGFIEIQVFLKKRLGFILGMHWTQAKG